MFEEMTFEHIMDEMMKEMPNGVDTSEGSLLYNACAKQAVRLEEAYIILSGIEQNMFADTADLEHLIRMGDDRGCYINEATYAEFKAQFNCKMEPGSRFNCGEFNYRVFRSVDEEQFIYEIGCDEPGSGPNTILGALTPIEYIEDFEWGKILECIKKGEDQESTEDYRARLLSTFNYRGFAGNREYYIGRINEMDGVFGCKVERVQAPTDRIKITIIGDDFRTPPEEVISSVQSQTDPVVNSGEGEGIAPIGHRVTIVGVEETAVDIETTITYEAGYSHEDLQSYILEKIEEYLLELRQTWERSSAIVVRILQIEAKIVDIEGILDVTGTKLNGVAENLQILDGTVPVKGEITCL